MPHVTPFKAVIYNANKTKNLSKVVAPPYDVIPKKMQDALYCRDPYNIIRLILGKIRKRDSARNNRYTRAKRFFETWLRTHVMVYDEKNAFYIYSQKYADDKKETETIGFIGLVKLNRSKKKKILPHENTLLAPKLDRLNLMRAVSANLSPIFVLYEDKSHSVSNILKRFCLENKPFIDIGFDNVRHKAWKMSDAALIKRIEKIMRPKDIFIADGHHRYEVALAYSIEAQASLLPPAVKRNSKFMMAYFVESDERMLTILPAHRLIKDIGALKRKDITGRLKSFFNIERMGNLDLLISKLRILKDSYAFGIYLGKRDFYIIKLKRLTISDMLIKNNSKDWKRLDVTILHLFVLEYVLGIRDDDDNVEFVIDAKLAARLVKSGKYKIAFFLNPTKVSQVRRIARLGERMPRKATYFYPKPLSGLVINKLY